MKRLVVFLVFGVLVALAGCSGDGTTGPDGAETPEAAVTIGPGGGSLEVGDFLLTVPQGAFGSDVELRLYEASAEHGFGSAAVSRCFRLEGLPVEFADSLLVRIGLEATTDTLIFIAHGETGDVIDPDFNRYDATVYSLHRARESGGFCECKLPPTTGGALTATGGSRRTGQSGSRAPEGLRSAAPAAEGRTDHFSAIAGYRIHRTESHFDIAYPLYLLDYVDDIGIYFEAARDSVLKTGIGYDNREWDWPVAIMIKEFPAVYRNLFMLGSFHRLTGPKFTFNESEISQASLSSIKRLAFHQMLSAAQGLPEYKKFYSDSCRVAWDGAVRAWFEEKAADAGTFVRPDAFVGHEMSALQGLPVTFTYASLALPYGSGWAAVVKYLAGRYGKEMLGDIYWDIQTTGAHPVNALMANIPDPTYNWWPHFVDAYVGGNIYAVDSHKFLSNTQLRFTIDDAADTAWVSINYYPQVSVLMFRFDLEYALIDDSARMEFGLTSLEVNSDYLNVLIYKISDGALAYLAEGNPVTVEDIKALTLAGDDLLAVAVYSYNDEPYDELETATFRASMVSEPQLEHNYCEIVLQGITEHVHYENGGTGDYTTTFNQTWSTYGVFTDNVFFGEYDIALGEETEAGSIYVAVDARTMRVTSFYATDTQSEPGFTHYQRVESVDGSPLPVGAEPGVDLIFQIEGAHNAPCAYFDYWSLLRRMPPEYDYRVETTTSTECTEFYSAVMIKFYDR